MLTRVERTPTYILSLAIGPAESMDMAHPASGDMAHPAMGDSTMMAPAPMDDQGMAVNHRLDVRITRADSGAIVDDVFPTIRVTDKATGESRDLPQVMGMPGMTNDFRYGQNVWLPDGTYHITGFRRPDRYSPIPRRDRHGSRDGNGTGTGNARHGFPTADHAVKQSTEKQISDRSTDCRSDLSMAGACLPLCGDRCRPCVSKSTC
jgi:hypothetical protein